MCFEEAGVIQGKVKRNGLEGAEYQERYLLHLFSLLEEIWEAKGLYLRGLRGIRVLSEQSGSNTAKKRRMHSRKTVRI